MGLGILAAVKHFYTRIVNKATRVTWPPIRGLFECTILASQALVKNNRRSAPKPFPPLRGIKFVVLLADLMIY